MKQRNCREIPAKNIYPKLSLLPHPKYQPTTILSPSNMDDLRELSSVEDTSIHEIPLIQFDDHRAFPVTSSLEATSKNEFLDEDDDESEDYEPRYIRRFQDSTKALANNQEPVLLTTSTPIPSNSQNYPASIQTGNQGSLDWPAKHALDPTTLYLDNKNDDGYNPGYDPDYEVSDYAASCSTGTIPEANEPGGKYSIAESLEYLHQQDTERDRLINVSPISHLSAQHDLTGTQDLHQENSDLHRQVQDLRQILADREHVSTWQNAVGGNGDHARVLPGSSPSVGKLLEPQVATPKSATQRATMEVDAIANLRIAGGNIDRAGPLRASRLSASPVKRAGPQQSRRTLAWNPNERAILLNINNERVDATTEKIDYEVMEDMMDRIEVRKFCNYHHLLGGCITTFNGGTCKYVHDPELNAMQLAALRTVVRRRPCELGSECRRSDCIYGHVCREQCPKATCSLKRFHGVDATAVKVWRKHG